MSLTRGSASSLERAVLGTEQTRRPKRKRKSRRLPRTMSAVAATLVLGMVAAACGSHSKSATAKVSSSANTTSSGSAPAFTLAYTASWTPYSYNPFNPHFLDLYSFVLMPLAYALPPKVGVYEPQLASGWKVNGQTITVTLRKDAKWQNGQPVTSTDVLDSMMLWGTDGNSIWEDLDSVATPNSHSIVLKCKPGIAATNVLETFLGITPVPSSVYGRFIPANFEQTLYSYWAKMAASPSSAATSPQSTTVENVYKKLEAYSPSTVIGDGPFRVIRTTSEDVLMRKWSGFWDASNIHVDTFELQAFAGGNNTVYPSIFSYRTDLAQVGAPAPIVEKFLHTPDVHYTTNNNYACFAIYINERHYPLNLLAVRQALAYLIPRKKLLVEQDAGKTPHKYTKYITGLVDSVAHQWLTPSQFDSLHRYAYNPAKAAALLEGAGFHKDGGRWMLPDGKPFTLTIGGPAGWSGPTIGIEIVARMLSSFGIPTTASAIGQPQYWTYQQQGDFELDWGWVANSGNLSPLSELTVPLETYNYPTSGAYKGDSGIGFGPVEDVPGIGKVDVSAWFASSEAVNTVPGKKMAELTRDWVRLVNQQVPFIQYASKFQQEEYSTKFYSDFPPDSSELWNLAGFNWNAGIVDMLEHGYIKPRS